MKKEIRDFHKLTELKVQQLNETFEWPEYKTDRERIKAYSKQFKNKQVADAFNEIYGVKLKHQEEIVPQQAKVGDVLKVFIKAIKKGEVLFDNTFLKDTLHCRTNLYKYEKLRDFLPTKPIEVKVVDVNKRGYVVDPLLPMFENWLNPILKDPTIQYNIKGPKNVIVKNLQLTKGGYIGKVSIPPVSNFVGEDVEMEAFIPGSQIVLNIENDFEKWIGKDVPAFITNYIPKPGSFNGEMSLICSTKQYLKLNGDLNKIELFKAWTEDGEAWTKFADTVYTGLVTGVINSAKKCGVFIEIPEYDITGMVPTKPTELVHFKPGMKISVNITGFEEEMVYNKEVQQMQHAIPYKIENDCLKECNLKPILQFAAVFGEA